MTQTGFRAATALMIAVMAASEAATPSEAAGAAESPTCQALPAGAMQRVCHWPVGEGQSRQGTACAGALAPVRAGTTII